jgi:hypothetical protein
MKHIKIFEEYSDEELRGLQDDLHDIGHKTKFILGEDFGLGDKLNEPEGNGYFPRISEELLNYLIKKGEIIKGDFPNEFKFKDGKKWGLKKINWVEIARHYLDDDKKSLWLIRLYSGYDDFDKVVNIILSKLSEIRI